MRMKSSPAVTSAPTLRSSATIAAMRSVSLTRQLAMLCSSVGPSANRASTASVIAASGMWLQSSCSARSGHAPRDTRSRPGSLVTVAPIACAACTKAMSPWIEPLSTPSMHSGFCALAAMAPSAMKYDADEASPSTCRSPGEV